MSVFLLNAALPSEILRPLCDDTLGLASVLVTAHQKCFSHLQVQIWYKLGLPVQTFLARIFDFFLGHCTRSDIVCLGVTYLLLQPDLTQICLFIVGSEQGFCSTDSVSCCIVCIRVSRSHDHSLGTRGNVEQGPSMRGRCSSSQSCTVSLTPLCLLTWII